MTSEPDSAGKILLEILIHGPLSRAELARRLGLSEGSLTRLTKPLVASGRLIEREPQHQSMGRPSLPLDINPSAEIFAGVKITTDSVFTVITDLRGKVLAERQSTLEDHDPAHVVGTVLAEIKAVGHPFGPPSGIGISLGGRAADRRTVSDSGIMGWHQVPLADMVEAAMGVPVTVENDVTALAQAQHWFGRGRGLESFVLVTIGAGVGAGVVTHYALATGVNGAAGSIGHQLLMHNDAVCWRGHHGCAHAMLTTGAIEAAAEKLTGRSVGYADIIRGALDGDAAMREVTDTAGRALGLLIASIANMFDPQKIILAGEGAGLANVAQSAVLTAVLESTAADIAPTPVDVQPFEFNEWARGAAAVAIYTHMTQPG